MFNPSRLSLARKRRRLTGKGLAELSGLTPVTISRLEQGINEPEPGSVECLARALEYPESFFFGDDVEDIPVEAVSFRSLKKMSAREREAAIAAGGLGLLVSDWMSAEFNLPPTDIPPLDHRNAEQAAVDLRQAWAIGEKPVSNMIKLLESKGIRVFSLTEKTSNVDAYSFWRDDTPFVFLNNFKTAERSIFDCAHELGHLVLHRHQGPRQLRDSEYEADKFASSFLMPRNDVLARMPRLVTVDEIIRMKGRWRVSAMALAYRLRDLNILTDWQYRSACIELSSRGYRSKEQIGVDRETSTLWQKILSELWSERITKNDIALEIGIPLDELERLLFGITQSVQTKENVAQIKGLRLVS